MNINVDISEVMNVVERYCEDMATLNRANMSGADLATMEFLEIRKSESQAVLFAVANVLRTRAWRLLMVSRWVRRHDLKIGSECFMSQDKIAEFLVLHEKLTVGFQERAYRERLARKGEQQLYDSAEDEMEVPDGQSYPNL